MSKAFTREEDAGDDLEELEDAGYQVLVQNEGMPRGVMLSAQASKSAKAFSGGMPSRAS